MATIRIKKDFFTRDVLELAPALLGKKLVRVYPGGTTGSFIITETEAYRGEIDRACHASRGRTPRTEIMYSEGGVLYVYLVYGIHWMLNIVTGREGDPQAVLIRALEETLSPSEHQSESQACQETCSLPAGQAGTDATGNNATEQEPVSKQITGPGRLTKTLGIDGSFNGEPLYGPGRIRLEDTGITLPYTTTPRIGIDYACEPWRSKPWRFVAE